MTRLWFTAPAATREEALPLGTGRLGALCFGGVDTELVQLNDDRLWTGSPLPPPSDDPAPTPAKYLPLANLMLVGGPAQADSYRRELDLRTGVYTMSYRTSATQVRREAVCHGGLHVLALRVTGAQAGLLLRGALPGEHFTSSGRVVGVRGRVPSGMAWAVVAAVDGDTVFVTTETGYRGPGTEPVDDPAECSRLALARIEWARRLGWTEFREQAVRNHQALFDRVSLQLGPAPDLPTGERLAQPDRTLAALLFQYGRYLLITSSRPGTLPAWRQGVWGADARSAGSSWMANRLAKATALPTWPHIRNQDTDAHSAGNPGMACGPAEVAALPAWRQGIRDPDADAQPEGNPGSIRNPDADAHSEGTLGMACGPAEVAALPAWRQSIRDTDAQPADTSRMTNRSADTTALPAWPHIRNQDADAQPAGMTCWPAEITALPECHEPLLEFVAKLAGFGAVTAKALYGAPGWMSHHDSDPWCRTTPAGEPAWPMAGAWLSLHLWEHYAFSGDVGWLRDHAWPVLRGAAEFYLHWLASSDPGSTVELALTAELFSNVLAAAGVLGIRDDVVDGVREAELPETDLLAVMGDTSPVWKAALWARLGDGDRAHTALSELLSGLSPNLCARLDANLGATATIAEMLLQSRTGELRLLPALPSAWPTGVVRGLRARGGVAVDLWWDEGELRAVGLRALDAEKTVTLAYRGRTAEVTVRPDVLLMLDERLGSADGLP